MSKSNVQTFLSYLAFEGFVLRIGLEISLTVILHTVLFQITKSFMPLAQAAMISWLISCVAVMLLDKLFLSKPAEIYRKAYLCYLSGGFDKSLELLSTIGPESDNLIKLSNNSYYLRKGELLTKSGDFKAAKQAFNSVNDTSLEKLAVLKYRFFLEKGEEDKAEQHLNESLEKIGKLPSLINEKGRKLLRDKKYWEAKKCFKESVELASSGFNYATAIAYLGLCNLKTGHAEQGLEILEGIIPEIQSEMSFTDSIKPVLAEVLCYRSHYYATHRLPNKAMLDLKYANSICNFPYLAKITKEIKEELELSYQL